MNSDYDYLFKFLIIGDSCVGKSCLLMRFAHDQFTETFVTTVGVDFSIRTIAVNDKLIKLQIWDCAGQERFRAIVTSYYRGVHGVILAYSVADKKTFDNVKWWYSECKKRCDDTVGFILVGTKSDLNNKREVNYEQGQELAKELGVKFVETSAKIGTYVDDIFDQLTKTTIELYLPKIKINNTSDNTIKKLSKSKPIQENNSKKFGCC